MQKITAANYYKRNTDLKEERQTNKTIRFLGRILCGCASGYAFLILFVLLLNVSNMTIGRIGQIGEQAYVSIPVPMPPYRIILWNTSVETLEIAKFILILSIFVISSFISSVIFLQTKNIYNVFLALGLEYVPILFIGNHLKAQGVALYLIMFVIGVFVICCSTLLRNIFRRDCDHCARPFPNPS